MFFATASGLSVWDGIRWKNYSIPSGNYLRALCYDRVHKRLYSAGDNEFGYWELNDFGDYEYMPLYTNDNIKEAKIFWRCVEDGGYVYFQTHYTIYKYDYKADRVNMAMMCNNIHYIHKTGDDLIVQVEDSFYYMNRGKMEALPFKLSDRVVGIVENDGKMCLFTESEGIWVADGAKLSVLNPETSERLSSVKIFSMCGYNDSTFLVGTILGGFYWLDSKGEIIEHINQTLQNTTVLSLGHDNAGDIWLGLDGGIARVARDESRSYFHSLTLRIGSVYTEVSYRGRLYMGTNKGLYVIDEQRNPKLIEGSQGQVWSISVVGEDLLVCHDKGICRLEGEGLRLLPFDGAWEIRPIGEKNFYMATGYRGVAIYELVNGHLEYRHKIQDLDISSTSTLFDKYGFWWMRTTGNWIVRLKLNKDYTKVDDIRYYQCPDKSDSFGRILELDGEVVCYNSHKAYSFDIQNDTIIENAHYTDLLQHCEEPLVAMTQSGNLFYYITRSHIGLLERDGKSFYNRMRLPNDQVGDMIPEDFRRFQFADRETLALGLQNGVLFFSVGDVSSAELYPMRLRRAELLGFDGERRKLNLAGDFVVPFKMTGICLSFTGFLPNSLISWKLDDGEWTDVHVKKDLTLSFLPFGCHKLYVRNHANQVWTCNLEVEEPWYLNPWWMGMLVMGAIGVVILAFVGNTKRLELRHQRVLDRQSEEMRRQRQQHDMDMLRLEVKEKDKKLISFTMDGINRNNMLNDIREEVLMLKNGNPGLEPKVKAIAKRIDSHMNEKENWKTFEKYFNNIYDGFFDRLIARYPDLTRSELKICAYIKLNLSTKEIAVLLNISTASVEMARYRLRKKLSISSEVSLLKLMSEM